MWWYDADTDARDAHVTWRRVEQDERGVQTVEQYNVANARWILRAGTHYVTYEDEPAAGEGHGTNAGDAAGGGTRMRTTLRIEQAQLTLIRHGSLRWNHTFRVGPTQTSTMHLGALAIPIATDTSRVDVDVRPTGGHVRLVYRMSVGGDTQDVELEIRFEVV